MSNNVLDFLKNFSEEGENVDFHTANAIESAEALTTGSVGLDVALGCGGWPKGRITQIYGPSASGKTYLCLLAIKNAQAENSISKQIWIDAEQTFNPQWTEKLGIDLERLIIIDGEKAQIGRQCFEILIGIPREDAKTHMYDGKKQNGLFDEIALKNLDVNLVVLDSLGAIIPPIEDVSVVGKANFPALPRFLSKELKRVSLDVKKANIPLIFINHVKTNMDPYASSSHSFSGGNSYTHFLSANIYVRPLGKKETQIFDEHENKIGHTLRATIEKTKFGPWPREAEFKINFTSGIVDTHIELVNTAIEKNIITKPTSMSYEFGEEKWVGMPKLLAAVEENLELRNSIEAALRNLLPKNSNSHKNEEVAEEPEEENKKGKRGRKSKNEE